MVEARASSPVPAQAIALTPVASSNRYSLFSPDPTILQWVLHQVCSHGIFEHVVQLGSDPLFATQRTVKRFFLPNFPPSTQDLVHPMGRRTFYRLHDFSNADRSIGVCERSQENMHMVGHDNRSIEAEHLAVPLKARSKDRLARVFRQQSARVRAEGDEEDLIVGLAVRQFTPIFVFPGH